MCVYCHQNKLNGKKYFGITSRPPVHRWGQNGQYHGLCQTLWNAPDVSTVCVAIIDENLNVVGGYQEIITHDQNIVTE